jgi:phosphate transport system protein
MSEHIVKAYGEELAQLSAEIARLGGLVEAQIAAAVDSMTRRDVAQATLVVKNDEQIDALQLEVEDKVLRMFALRQPMAVDLRHAMSAMKISMQLERCGDLAKNIAKRGLVLAKGEPVTPFNRSIDRMGKLVGERLKSVLDAYAAKDVAAAVDVWNRDEEVDEHYNAIFRELLTYMMGDPRTITPCTHLLFVAKNLERIGDHATNIAEIVHYEFTGDAILGLRPKFDTLQQD